MACSYDNGTGRAPLKGDFESCWISSDGSFCWAHGKYMDGRDDDRG